MAKQWKRLMECLWQCCERSNNVFVFLLASMARSIEQCGHHVTCANWNEP